MCAKKNKNKLAQARFKMLFTKSVNTDILNMSSK